MFLKLLEKALRQLGRLKREPPLLSAVILDEKGTIDDGLVDQSSRLCALNVEGQSTPADALGLVLYKFACPTTDADAETLVVVLAQDRGQYRFDF